MHDEVAEQDGSRRKKTNNGSEKGSSQRRAKARGGTVGIEVTEEVSHEDVMRHCAQGGIVIRNRRIRADSLT